MVAEQQILEDAVAVGLVRLVALALIQAEVVVGQ